MKYKIETITEGFKKIPITKSSLDKIKAYARIAGDKEIYGFLLAPKDSEDCIVRRVVLARGHEVTGASVNLDGDSAAYSKEEIESLECKSLGFWHSHANFNAFHSGIDDLNMASLYRSFSRDNEETHSKKRNIRFIDRENGEIVYRVNGIEFGILLRDPEKSCERRFLSQEGVESKNILAGITENLEVLLRDSGIVLELENIEELRVRRYKEEHFSSIGFAYSIVVNRNGKEYGEIAVNRFCGLCQKEEPRIYKDVSLKVIDDLDELTLERDIQERVKGIISPIQKKVVGAMGKVQKIIKVNVGEICHHKQDMKGRGE